VGVGHEVERVRPGGRGASRLRRYDGLDVTMVLKLMEMTLYLMRLLIFSRLRERMMGEEYENFEEETTVRASMFWMRWRR
jgi:hypothetical protein